MPGHCKNRTPPACCIPAAGRACLLLAMALLTPGFFPSPGSCVRLFAAPPQEEKKAPPAGKVIKLKARPAQVKEVEKKAVPAQNAPLKDAVKALQKAIKGERPSRKPRLLPPRQQQENQVERCAEAPPPLQCFI